MMVDAPDISPGTVSRILWHFTGGPTWNVKEQKQNKAPKPAHESYRNLVSIVRSKELRLGTYKEVVNVILSEMRSTDSKSRSIKVQKNVPQQIESVPICCLSDIPAPHLRYHAYRYGKFAIGFHRDAVIRAGFNPVFYTLEDTPIVQSIYEGFTSLRFADPSVIQHAAHHIQYETIDWDEIDNDVPTFLWEIQAEADDLELGIDNAKKSLARFVSFVKTFSRDEFSTIYCEREWRSTARYVFDFDDVAMIVIPKEVNREKYFRNFVERVARKLRLPKRIPVVPWDDLVEH